MNGAPVDQIAAAHRDAWDTIAEDLDSLLPWVLTAVVEFMLVNTGLTSIRDLAYARLSISRLRYGVPVLDCCDLVRRGADRVRVAEYRDLQPADQQGSAGPRSSPSTSPSRLRRRPEASALGSASPATDTSLGFLANSVTITVRELHWCK
jgi:hypothetical protein